MAGERSSDDAERKLEAGTAKASEPPTTSSGGGLPPAFYIALWITLSSSIIIFNKWILTTAKFGKETPLPVLLLLLHVYDCLLTCL